MQRGFLNRPMGNIRKRTGAQTLGPSRQSLKPHVRSHANQKQAKPRRRWKPPPRSRNSTIRRRRPPKISREKPLSVTRSSVRKGNTSLGQTKTSKKRTGPKKKGEAFHRNRKWSHDQVFFFKNGTNLEKRVFGLLERRGVMEFFERTCGCLPPSGLPWWMDPRLIIVLGIPLLLISIAQFSILSTSRRRRSALMTSLGDLDPVRAAIQPGVALHEGNAWLATPMELTWDPLDLDVTFQHSEHVKRTAVRPQQQQRRSLDQSSPPFSKTSLRSHIPFPTAELLKRGMKVSHSSADQPIDQLMFRRKTRRNGSAEKRPARRHPTRRRRPSHPYGHGRRKQQKHQRPRTKEVLFKRPQVGGKMAAGNRPAFGGQRTSDLKASKVARHRVPGQHSSAEENGSKPQDKDVDEDVVHEVRISHRTLCQCGPPPLGGATVAAGRSGAVLLALLLSPLLAGLPLLGASSWVLVSDLGPAPAQASSQSSTPNSVYISRGSPPAAAPPPSTVTSTNTNPVTSSITNTAPSTSYSNNNNLDADNNMGGVTTVITNTNG